VPLGRIHREFIAAAYLVPGQGRLLIEGAESEVKPEMGGETALLPQSLALADKVGLIQAVKLISERDPGADPAADKLAAVLAGRYLHPGLDCGATPGSAGKGGFRSVRGGCRSGCGDGSMRMPAPDKQVKKGKKT
jgi:hypothetical protein